MLSIAATQELPIRPSPSSPQLDHHQVAAFLNNNTIMPHRVYEPTLVRTPSQASTSSTAMSASPSLASSASSVAAPSAVDTSVLQALEIARESPDGAQDPTVCKILERAIADIWSKVEASPDSYIMTRQEFAVFNFFQYRFRDNTNARLARSRFWDNLRV